MRQSPGVLIWFRKWLSPPLLIQNQKDLQGDNFLCDASILSHFSVTYSLTTFRKSKRFSMWIHLKIVRNINRWLWQWCYAKCSRARPPYISSNSYNQNIGSCANLLINNLVLPVFDMDGHSTLQLFTFLNYKVTYRTVLINWNKWILIELANTWNQVLICFGFPHELHTLFKSRLE